MPRIKYREIDFPDWKMDLINKSIGIVTDYKSQGYDLTLRQVYYQFVSRDWFPERWIDPTTGSKNNQKSYDKLGALLGDVRMAGVMDWDAMVDRTREKDGNTHWDNPQSIVDAVAAQYQIDKWEGQKYRPEVWVEKDALEGVVSVVARRLDVPYFSCRGYTSLTSIWQNAQYLKRIADDSTPVILHLGDHDPSGIDMSRDIEERVRTFMGENGDTLIFERVALNMDQVTQYDPPTNPAKITDSRSNSYISKFGESGWELDALDPKVIDAIIEKRISKYQNKKLFAEKKKTQDEHRELLEATSERWEEVSEFLGQ